jgi:hypothetical protein
MGFHLLSKEICINSFACKHRRDLSGTMYITNIRVSWVPDEETAGNINEVNIPMSDINVHKEIDFLVQVGSF